MQPTFKTNRGLGNTGCGNCLRSYRSQVSNHELVHLKGQGHRSRSDALKHFRSSNIDNKLFGLLNTLPRVFNIPYSIFRLSYRNTYHWGI